MQTAGRRALLVALVLPALLLGQVTGGRIGWVHSHDEHGGHLHLADVAAPGDVQALSAWHATQHHGDPDSRAHERPPAGLVFAVPALLASAPGPAGGLAPPSACKVLLGPEPLPLVELAGGTHQPELCRNGWPPQRTARSGVVALLRSSHALLI